MGLFAVYYGGAVEGMDGVDVGFPPANAGVGQTVERPVVLAGRMYNPSRVDEVVASPHFMTAHHLRVGDTLTLHLSTPAQAAAGIDASQGPPAGPQVKLTIVGVAQVPLLSRQPRGQRRDAADVRPLHPVPRRHPGPGRATPRPTSTRLIRLAGGEAAIPAFQPASPGRRDARTSTCGTTTPCSAGRSSRVSAYEAACLLAFGLAALLAALILVGQSRGQVRLRRDGGAAQCCEPWG